MSEGGEGTGDSAEAGVLSYENSAEAGGLSYANSETAESSATNQVYLFNTINGTAIHTTSDAVSSLETLLAGEGVQLNREAIEYAVKNGQSLEYILADIISGRRDNQYLTQGDENYSNMAVYADKDSTPTADDYKSIAERIAQKRQTGKIPDSTIANNPEIIEYNMEAWLSALKDFQSDPAKYNALSDYVRSIGREISEPKKAGLFDHQPNAVARTYAGETIEANIEMWNMLDRMSGQTGIPSSYLLEMAIAHEYFHSSQPEYILKGQPFPIVAEMDVEYNMANFFLNKSKSSADASDKTSYEDVARYCLDRHAALGQALQRN
jgi:hypothetical protein